MPSKKYSEEVDVNGETVTEVTHQLLLGGDQLTSARIRGCHAIRVNSTSDSQKLVGFIPCAEDWRTLLKVYIFILYYDSLLYLCR